MKAYGIEQGLNRYAEWKANKAKHRDSFKTRFAKLAAVAKLSFEIEEHKAEIARLRREIMDIESVPVRGDEK